MFTGFTMRRPDERNQSDAVVWRTGKQILRNGKKWQPVIRGVQCMDSIRVVVMNLEV